MAILIRQASYLIRDARRIERNVDLLIEGERITAIGPAESYHAGDFVVIDGRGCAVIPGLINAHSHLYQNFLKGLRDDIGLVEWCHATLYPLAYAIHQEHWGQGDETCGRHWAMLSALEMLRGGVTCCVDMNMNMDSVFTAWREVGIRGVAAVAVSDRWLPAPLRRSPELIRQDARQLAARWRNAHPRIKVVLGPSTPFLCSRELLLWARDTAAELDIGLQIHLAETRYEVAQVLAETGLTPVAYAHSLGLLGPRTTAVHCVHVTEAEMDLLAESGCTVVHCPKSNLKLGSGVAPIPAMLRRGVRVALAADGAASNDTLDMLEEMRFAALLHKGVNEDPTAITAHQVFEMATEAGARAMGFSAGRLDEGQLADLVLVRLDAAHMIPVHDILNQIVYCAKASDVETTIVGGEIVFNAGRITTVDEAQVRQAAAQYGEEMYRRGVTMWQQVSGG